MLNKRGIVGLARKLLHFSRTMKARILLTRSSVRMVRLLLLTRVKK